MTQSNSERNSIISFHSLHSTVKVARAGLKQGIWRSVAFLPQAHDLLNLLSCINQGYLPMSDMTLVVLAFHVNQSIKEIFHRNLLTGNMMEDKHCPEEVNNLLM